MIRAIVFIWLVMMSSSNASSFQKPHISLAKSWTFFRDFHIVKQSLDYSCGAASVATIFTYFYHIPVTEEDVLNEIEKFGASSFLDLKKVVEKRLFKGIGVKVGMDALMELKIPAIIHLTYKGQDHFSVIKTIDENNVHLADSSWGNRLLSINRFKQMFFVKDLMVGNALLILPKEKRPID